MKIVQNEWNWFDFFSAAVENVSAENNFSFHLTWCVCVCAIFNWLLTLVKTWALIVTTMNENELSMDWTQSVVVSKPFVGTVFFSMYALYVYKILCLCLYVFNHCILSNRNCLFILTLFTNASIFYLLPSDLPPPLASSSYSAMFHTLDQKTNHTHSNVMPICCMSSFNGKSHQIHAHTHTHSAQSCARVNTQTIQSIFERFFYSVRVIFIIVWFFVNFPFALTMLHDRFNDAWWETHSRMLCWTVLCLNLMCVPW